MKLVLSEDTFLKMYVFLPEKYTNSNVKKQKLNAVSIHEFFFQIEYKMRMQIQLCSAVCMRLSLEIQYHCLSIVNSLFYRH